MKKDSELVGADEIRYSWMHEKQKMFSPQKSWVEKLYDKCKKFGHFNKPRLSNSAFIVKHFAGEISIILVNGLEINCPLL